jgi:hypothetical protein
VRTAAVALVSLLLAVPAAGGAGVRRARSNLLVALPSLGSVTWRCNADGSAWALGYREFWTSATTELTLRTAGRVRTRQTVNPRELVGFPFLRAPRQRLTLVQATEPGTITAEIRVDFRPYGRGYGSCAQYTPPRFTAAVTFRSSAR